jgi:hypothetical protein
MRYEDGLAELFEAGSASLTLMAQAHIGGFSERLPDWLKSAERKNSRLQAKSFQQLFAALLTGDAATIEAALLDANAQKLVAYQWGRLSAKASTPEWLDEALGAVIDPLILLGRSELISVLHANSLQRLGAGANSAITATAAQALGSADEWDHALQVLDQARRSNADIKIARVNESLIWKYAYLYGPRR